jgi:iron complex outermembrane receptor protein
MRAPLAVTIIGQQQLRTTRGYGLDEVLGTVPGVLAQSRSGNQDVRITIRGFGARGAGDRSNAGTSRGIRVLLDGIPETEPDGRTSFDDIDLATAERIDIVRSNASALWGNAAGGMINVSTLPTFASSQLGAEQQLGSFGLKREVLRFGMGSGGIKLSSSFVHSDFDGWRAGSSSRRSIVNANLTSQTGDATRLGVFATATNNLFYIPGPLTQAQVDADPEQANATYLARRERRYNRIGRLGATLTHEITPNHQISGMVFVNPKFLQRSERGTFRDFTRYHTGANMQYTGSGKLGEKVRSQFSAGIDDAYQDGAILFYGLTAAGERADNLRDNKREGANNFGVFTQEQLDLGEKVSLTLGARYDNIHYIFRSFIEPNLNDQRDFTRLSPKLGLLYRLGSSHTVYANVGGGVEAPAGNETDPASTFGQDLVYGINPLLEPIISTTFELGTKHIVAGRGVLQSFSYDIAAYQTNVQNEIVPYRGGRFYFTAGEARRRGLEIGASAFAAHGFSLETALTLSNNTYQKYLVDSVHYDLALANHFANYAGNKIVGVPSMYASAMVGFAPAELKGLGLKLSLTRIGDYFTDDANVVSVPAYSVLNATISLNRVVSVANGVGIRGFISINNLTDKQYIGSAFLNPDYVGGVPVAFEPGLPRNMTVSFSLERLR